MFSSFQLSLISKIVHLITYITQQCALKLGLDTVKVMAEVQAGTHLVGFQQLYPTHTARGAWIIL